MPTRVFTLGAPVNPEWDLNRALGFLWNPDFAALKSGKVWLEAAGQVFFSTSVGIGVLLTYATYMKSRDDVLLPATTASVFPADLPFTGRTLPTLSEIRRTAFKAAAVSAPSMIRNSRGVSRQKSCGERRSRCSPNRISPGQSSPLIRPRAP